MTIASEIARIQGNIADAYNSCAVKGATMPVTNNSASLATTIDSITAGGGGELGSLGIGKYYVNNGVAQPQAGDVSNAFQIITSVADNGMNNACGFMYNITGVVNLCNLTTVGNNGMNNAFTSCNNITGVNLINLKNIGTNGLYDAFNSCRNLSGDVTIGATSFENGRSLCGTFIGTNVNTVYFTNLQYLNAFNVMDSCFGRSFSPLCNIVSLNMSNLIYVNYAGLARVCFNCKNLESFNFQNLQGVGLYGLQGAFTNCANLTEAYFNSLNQLNSSALIGCFINCTNLKNVYFPALTNSSFGSDYDQFNNMLTGVNGCTVHFPVDIQSKIGGWSAVTSGFSGTNTTVLFDL